MIKIHSFRASAHTMKKIRITGGVCFQMPPLFLLFLLFSVFFLRSSTAGYAYNATSFTAIDCGSSGDANDSSGRMWKGENVAARLDDQTNGSVSREVSQISSSLETIPYTTARLSRSPFSYSLRVPAGPKFIRLYFNPTSYPDFNRSDAFFAVHVAGYTLLSNFSAALVADDLRVDGFFREFCMNIDENRLLNFTFTPTSSMPNSYAFINGIEILSIPDNFYYSLEDEDGFKYVGSENPYRLEKNMALETVYRINAGGAFINPRDDSGMFRSWTGDDEDYLTDGGPSVLPVNNSFDPVFTALAPNFTAPVPVYQTARTMGVNTTQNKNYKLTWQFPVDANFFYFVRMHFCEFQKEVVASATRIFQIYIDDQLAERRLDVVDLGNGEAKVAVFSDYAVLMGPRGTEKRRNLSIALHPAPAYMTKYSDAILNGLEIFKINSSNGNLAGPNPDLQPQQNIPPTPTIKEKNNGGRKLFIIIGVTVSGFTVLCVLFLAFFVLRGRNKKAKDSAFPDASSWWSQPSTTTKSTKSHGSSTLPSDLCRHFSLSEIKSATNNFDKVFIIGAGGFGNVYKGFIDGGATTVAIKRLDPESQQGALEFKTEIEMLSQLRHLHLVSLIGYCNDDNEMILVYDYMARGTLRDHLYGSSNPNPLPWKQRLEICIGAARGLQYLHGGAKYTIIHRDVKTTNILLDEKWVAKVSDFGLSKVGPTNMSRRHVSTVVKGSFGYLDPEYYRRQQLTEKSDVYSLGVVLCEVLCARPPIQRTADKRQTSLASWAQLCHRRGTIDQIVDPSLKHRIAPECLKKYVEVALSCLLDEGIERPSMNDVVWGLEFALQLQESAEQGNELGGAIFGAVDSETAPLKNDSSYVDDSGEVFSSIGDHVMESRSTSSFVVTTSDDQSVLSKESDRLVSGAVFSEIRNPQAR